MCIITLIVIASLTLFNCAVETDVFGPNDGEGGAAAGESVGFPNVDFDAPEDSPLEPPSFDLEVEVDEEGAPLCIPGEAWRCVFEDGSCGIQLCIDGYNVTRCSKESPVPIE